MTAMSEYRGCELPEDLWYDLDYLWARPNGDGTFRSLYDRIVIRNKQLEDLRDAQERRRK